MPDVENVVNALEWLLENMVDPFNDFMLFDYDGPIVLANKPIIEDTLALLKAQEPEAMDASKPDSDIGCWYDITHNYTLEQVVSALKEQEPPTSEFISSAIECLLHPQDADDSDMAKAIDTAVRAMRLLKAQEPVKPIIDIRHGKSMWRCGSCATALQPNQIHTKFCFNCGKAVKWE